MLPTKKHERIALGIGGAVALLIAIGIATGGGNDKTVKSAESSSTASTKKVGQKAPESIIPTPSPDTPVHHHNREAARQRWPQPKHGIATL